MKLFIIKNKAFLIAKLLCALSLAYGASLASAASPDEAALDEDAVSTVPLLADPANEPIRVLFIEPPLPLSVIEQGQTRQPLSQEAPTEQAADANLVSPYADIDPAQRTYLQRLEDIDSFDQIVEALEIKGGAWSPQIAEELNSLGDLLQAQGEHAKAIEIFDRAVHINRVNNGLFSTTQVPLLQKVVRGHVALGQWQEADDKQQYAFYVQTRAYRIDDPRMIDVFDRLARWNVASFYRGIDEEPTARLLQTYLLYKTAAESVAVHFGTRDPRYIGFLHSAASAADMLSRYSPEGETVGTPANPDLRMSTRFAGVSVAPQGRSNEAEAALQRVVDFYNDPELPATDETRLRRARALAEMGDWYLLRDRRQAALRTYTEAYAQLADTPNADALLGEVFAGIAFMPIFMNFDAQRKEAFGIGPDSPYRKGYVDLAFDVSQFGRLSNFEVLAVEPAQAMWADIQVITSIRARLVRPKIENGVTVGSNGERYRFYFWY